MTKAYVEYKRPSDVSTRGISEADWAMVGVENQKSLEWTPANNWQVPESDITAGAWPYIKADPSFVRVVESEAESGSKVSESKVRGANKSVS